MYLDRMSEKAKFVIEKVLKLTPTKYAPDDCVIFFKGFFRNREVWLYPPRATEPLGRTGHGYWILRIEGQDGEYILNDFMLENLGSVSWQNIVQVEHEQDKTPYYKEKYKVQKSSFFLGFDCVETLERDGAK